MISAEYVINEDDVRACALHFYSVGLQRKGERSIAWVGTSATLFCFAVGLLFFEPTPGARILGAVLLVVAVLITLRFPTDYYSSLTRWAQQALRSVSYKNQTGRRQVSMTDEGIFVSSEQGELKFFWAEATGVVLTTEYLFVHLYGNSGIVIPRREVASSIIEEMAAFAESQLKTVEQRANAVRQSARRESPPT